MEFKSVCDLDDNVTLKSCLNPTEDCEDSMNFRGFVYSNTDGSFVSKSLPFSYEKTNLDKEGIALFLKDIQIENCHIYDSLEGTILRMFCYNDTWYTTTNKKLNAFKSRWIDPRSFGDMFTEYLKSVKVSTLSETLYNVLEDFQSTLNKDHTYIFLMTSSYNNKLVCRTDRYSEVYHVGTYKENTSVFDMNDDVGISKLKRLSFSSIDEVCDYVESTGITTQGVIMFLPIEKLDCDSHVHVKQLKVLNQTYKEYADIRGNDYNILYRYLTIRTDYRKSQILRFLYSTLITTFDFVDTFLRNLTFYIYSVYRSRYIDKQFVIVDHYSHSILKSLHDWHCCNRQNNIVSLSIVSSKIHSNIKSLFNVVNSLLVKSTRI
jgi:hypothetical protein